MRTLTAVFAALLLLAACGDDGEDDLAAGSDPPEPEQAGDAPDGTIAVHLEETEGVFIEGFEVGLRFETPDGEVLDRVVWSEFVAGQGDEPDLDAYYDSVYEVTVPAGAVTVLGKVTIGIGPPPEPIDPAGDLPCRLDVEVPDGGRVEVEVAFDTEGDCLRPVGP